MAKKRERITVDPAIGVMDLQRVLVRHMELQPEKDLWALLRHPTNSVWSWKTAVSLQWLAQAKDLLADFCRIAPNGLLPAKKLRIAIHRLVTDSNKKVNRTQYHTDDFVDQLDQRIRVLLAQARSLKKQEDYVTAMKKATQADKDAVDELLSHIRLGMDDEEQPEQSAGASSSSLALVPFTGGAAKQTSPAVPPEDVFKRILEKKDSSPMKPLKSPKRLRTTAAASSSSGPGFMMMVGNVASSSESEIMEDSICKKLPVGKPQVEKAIGHGLDADDFRIVDASLEDKVVKASKKAACQKKPAAKVKAANPAVPEPKLKCTFKHRKTSSVYAKERKLRLSMGDSPETAKRFARSAMQDTAARIDAGLLKEE